MRRAEQVTFGTSGLERAADLRGDDGKLRDLAARDDAATLTLWRGKPLFSGDGLAWVNPDHPIFADAGPAIFLGLDDGRPRFARDLSNWTPEDVPQTLGAFHDPSEQRHPGVDDAAFAELRTRMTRLIPREAELAATAKAVLAWHATHGFCARCGAETRMTQGGWQRDCTACEGRHFPRTDPVVIMLVTHGNSVLVGRSPGWPEGMYSLLAGFVEPGETIEAAVRRETLEEAGIRVGAVRYLSSQPWPFPMSLMFGCHGEALSRDITLDPAELDDAIWVSRERMLDVLAGRDETLTAAREGAIARFLIEAWVADDLE